jgi:DNA repair exonuclease SbcCD ATPase subunit
MRTESNLEDLPNQLASLKQKIAKATAYRDLIRSQIDSEEKKVEQFRYDADLNQRSSEVIKSWLEDLLKANIDSVADLVTNGLNNIIDDQDLQFHINQDIKYNRLSINFAISEDGVEGDPLLSFGGGAVLIASLILRLSVMARMNMANLLLLDESMSALANQYVPAAAEFMKQISEKTGVHILMVTHNEEFMANSHIAYEGIMIPAGDGRPNKTLQLKRRFVR